MTIIQPVTTSDSLNLELPGGRRCRLVLAPGALARLPELWDPDWSAAAVVGDETVLGLYGEAVARLLEPVTGELLQLGFPPGEAHKTRATKQALEDRLLAAGLDRRCCVVGLGGGISLDLAGFVAATYLRGVPWVGLPTSLLAQVDAAVGGKTGVNTPWGKNLVGAFHQPRLVLMDSALLATLPAEEWPNGLAEMVKHALIADAELWGWIEGHLPLLRQPGQVDPHPLRRCVEIKAAVVRQDEREQGLRAVLNFGHTVGHALEGACGPSLPHGRAVALGMLVEGILARQLCGFPPADLARLGQVLARLGLASGLPELDFERLRPFLGLDKKRRGGRLRLALPAAIGRMAGADSGYTLAVEPEQLRRAWDEARG